MFIVIEGADAVGKHTMSERLVDKLNRLNRYANLVSFPRYDTPTGQAILRHLKRKTVLADAEQMTHGWVVPSPDDALAFQGLMLLDKCAAAPIIARDLSEGTNVVADRWWFSAWAYGGTEGVNEDFLEQIHWSLPKSHLNILLDLDPTIAASRRPNARDRYEEDRARMETVRDRYRTFWNRKIEQGLREYVIVNAALSSDEVEAQIWRHVEWRLERQA